MIAVLTLVFFTVALAAIANYRQDRAEEKYQEYLENKALGYRVIQHKGVIYCTVRGHIWKCENDGMDWKRAELPDGIVRKQGGLFKKKSNVRYFSIPLLFKKRRWEKH